MTYAQVSSRGTVSSLDQRSGSSRKYRNGTRRGVVCIYGDTGTRDSWYALDEGAAPVGRQLYYIHRAGFPTASVDIGTLWGNSTMRTRMTNLRTNQQAAGAANQFASGKVHLLGASAGGLSCLNWAYNNPTLVQSIALVIPVVDVQAIYDGNVNGFQAEISAAYGGRPGDSDNPNSHASFYTQFPMVLYYSTTDTITPAATSTAFATAAGADAESMGAQGHFWSDPFNGPNLADFFWKAEGGGTDEYDRLSHLHAAGRGQ